MKQTQTKIEHLTLKKMVALAQPYTWHILLVLLLIGATSALGVVPAFLSQQIVDRGILGRNVFTLITCSILSLMTVVSMSLLSIFLSFQTLYISQRLMGDLRERLYAHLMRLSLRFFSTMKLGDLISRFTNDIGGFQYLFNSTIVSFVSNITTFLITLLFMFLFNWALTLVALASVATFILPTIAVGKISRTMSKEVQQKWADLDTSLEETLDISAILLIKNYGRQQEEIQRFHQTSRDLVALSIRQALVGRWLYMVVGLTATLGPVLIYLIGGLKVIGILPGALTLGQIVSFTALLGRLLGPAGSLSNMWIGVQQVGAQLDRVFAIFDEAPQIEDAVGAIVLPSMAGSITFQRVEFSYGEGFALQDINLMIKPGQMAAIVGPSGSGKTTLSYLLTRMYDVTEGAVLIDGHDVRSLQRTTLAQHIGMVTQETYLFHDTVRQNIAYGRPGASEEDIIAAAKAAAIHEVIMRLPKRYDTLVGERGYAFSGGEKQRLAIARVILKDPRIIILDEATSSLDSGSESLIQAALVPLMRQRTAVVIAHRLSTILTADRIFVLDRGRLIEQGTHQELLAQGGLYTKLYREQFQTETERVPMTSPPSLLVKRRLVHF